MTTAHIRQPETRLMAEYLAERYPEGGYRHRVPLGPPLPGTVEEKGLGAALLSSRPWRPEVDAVAPEHGRLILIEAKLFKIVDGLAKLPLYKSLIASTPELHQWRAWPVVMRLVAPWRPPQAVAMAEAAGIEIDVFAPAWVQDYVAQYHEYWSRERRLAREDRRRLLEQLGIE